MRIIKEFLFGAEFSWVCGLKRLGAYKAQGCEQETWRNYTNLGLSFGSSGHKVQHFSLELLLLDFQTNVNSL